MDVSFPSITLLCLAILVSTTKILTAASSTDNDEYLKNTCSTTQYPSVCYKLLTPYASSIQTNPWKLCKAALSATIDAAKTTSVAIAKLSRQSGLTSQEAAVTKDCADNIADSSDELKRSVKALSKLRGTHNARERQFQVDNIKTWLSAAITDESTCTDGFSGTKVSEDVKQKIRNAISELTQVNCVSLSIFNHLPY